MMINKISEVNALNSLQNTKRSNNVAGSQYVSDEISVSDEAKAMAEAMFMNKVAEETPDVRSELVEQIKLAGRMAGENYWQLPSLPECKEAIKSDVADLLNSRR